MDEHTILNIIERISKLEEGFSNMQTQLLNIMECQSQEASNKDTHSSHKDDYMSDSMSESLSELGESEVSSDSSYESDQSVDSDFYKPISYSMMIELQRQKIEEFPEPKLLLSEEEIKEVKRNMEQLKLAVLKQTEKAKTKPNDASTD